MPHAKQQFIVTSEDQGQRLDIYLAGLLEEDFSRSRLKKMVEEGLVRVNGKEVRSHYKTKAHDRIEIVGSLTSEIHLSPENIPLDILYEDEDLVVLNKAAGLVVHPGNGNQEHTLVNALLYHISALREDCPDALRPGIVHRIDKDTSGILVVAKNEKAHTALAKQFKDHSIERIYYAIVRGVVQHDEGVCEEPVGKAFLSKKKMMIRPTGGKNALTYYKVLKRFANATLLEVTLGTGRTHQIRVHMAHLGHPIWGDMVYGIECRWMHRQALHAKVLGFRHPVTREKLRFETELPEDMKSFLRKLEQNEAS